MQVTIIFSKAEVLSHEMSGAASANHLNARLHFDAFYGTEGERIRGLTVAVHQPYGTGYEKETVEVWKPEGIAFPTWNNEKFHDLCEGYLRNAFGSTGSAVRIEGAAELVMKNSSSQVHDLKFMEVEEPSAAVMRAFNEAVARRG